MTSTNSSIGLIFCTEKNFTTINYENKLNVDFEKFLDAVNENCNLVDLKKIDDNKDNFESSFLVEFMDAKNMENLRKSLKKIENNINFEFIDNKNNF